MILVQFASAAGVEPAAFFYGRGEAQTSAIPTSSAKPADKGSSSEYRRAAALAAAQMCAAAEAAAHAILPSTSKPVGKCRLPGKTCANIYPKIKKAAIKPKA